MCIGSCVWWLIILCDKHCYGLGEKTVGVIGKDVDCEGHKKSTAVKRLPTAEVISAHDVPDIWIIKQRGLCERRSALLSVRCSSIQLVAAKNTNG